MTLKFNIKIIETDSQIRAAMLRALADEVNITISKSIPFIENQIKDIVKKAIINEPEYQSLIGGQLRYELGIPDALSRVNSIIDFWISNIVVINNGVKITNNGLSGGFSLEMIARDFANVLSMNDANVNDSQRGYSLPWLKWLLLEGGNILVKDYSVKFGASIYSRTGNAIMEDDPGSNWRVPAQFAGTINNNWITRAIDKLDDNIYNIFQTEITRNIP